jgi:hypothetical protein
MAVFSFGSFLDGCLGGEKWLYEQVDRFGSGTVVGPVKAGKSGTEHLAPRVKVWFG